MNNFLDYLNQSSEALLAEEKSLREDDRNDDAVLVKIKCNMYEIAAAFYNASVKSSAPDNWGEEFEKRTKQLLNSWKSSYDKAKAHNDVEKMIIEELKLKTFNEIIEKSKEY